MFLKAILICLLLMTALPASRTVCAMTPQEIEELRTEAARQMTGQGQYAEMLGGIANAIIVPEISSAFYKIEDDGGSDTNASTTKIPYYHSFSHTDFGFTPFLGGVLGYLSSSGSVSSYLPVTKGQLEMEEKWQAYSAMMEFGGKIPLSRGFFLAPSAIMAVVRIEHKADYLNEFSRRIVAPIYEGIIANYKIDAYTAGGALAGGYEGKFGKVDTGFIVKYIHSYTASFDTTNAAQEFNASTDIVNARLTLAGQRNYTSCPYPIIWQVFLGHTHFVGPGDSQVGFSYFHELGASIGLDIASYGILLRSFRLGASYLIGDKVSGWSLILGYDF